jgi:S-DNA-T family DNA segregation ATPase FtsK/SpoIIIE
MARKQASTEAAERGLGEIIGIVLIAVSVLLLAALLSYDRNDLAVNHVPPNLPKHNWVGTVGAVIGYGFFFFLGAAAYILPVLLLGFGLSAFLQPLAYLRRAWPWACVLQVAFAGMLDLYTAQFANIRAHLDSGSAGGILGSTLNRYIFMHLGSVGAPITFITLYIISLIFLTDFQLVEWVRSLRAAKKETSPLAAKEKEIDRRQQEVAEDARKLQDEIGKAEKPKKTRAEPAPVEVAAKPELGADGQPVPEPMVRDLSVPQPRAVEKPDKAAKGKPGSAPSPAPEPVTAPEGEVIPAAEVRAATTEEILGRPSAAPRKSGKGKAVAEPEAAPVTATTSAASATTEAAPAAATASAPAPEPEPAAVAVAANAPAPPADAAPTATDPSVAPPAPPPKPKPAPRKPKPIAVASTPLIGNYQLPSMSFLQLPDMTVKPTESREELMANAQLMKNTLAQFDIEVAVGDITKGPTITRYELHPAPGVRLEKITALNNNIAAALKAERIHILAPVPGKSSVGVEVPNAVKTKVIMRDLLESPEWTQTKARIPLALGKDVYGHPIVTDLAEMPHLLIAGSTGSGKSVCINAIIASLLYRFSPDQLRFVMIDPKVVELQQYNSLPHLVVPVVTDPKKVILALRWVVNEMEKRYQIFARVGVRNIKSFNERPKNKPLPPSEPELPLMARKEKIETNSEGFAVQLDEEIVIPRDEDIVIPEKLSYIVVIIDELADLMLVAPADVEMAIARITQMARAAGIHCIVATQRPSVDVITGVIKANIPARIAFQVAAKVDSRTILDAMGADKLLGKGDMLYLPPGSAKLIRAQGVLITDQEIQSVVDFIARQGKPSYEIEIHQQLQKPTSGLDGEDGGSGEDEDLIQQCIEVIRSEQKASVSLMQRRLRLGYTRAARIMDELENRGIVGPGKGAEPRDILIDLDGGGADGNPSA